MKLSDALVAISAHLRANASLTTLVGKEIHLDYPRDAAARDALYVPAGNRPFIWFGPVALVPASPCGGYRAEFRLYADSFAADRREALDVIEAVIAALPIAPEADPIAGLTLELLKGGSVIDPPHPRSAYADFALYL